MIEYGHRRPSLAAGPSTVGHEQGAIDPPKQADVPPAAGVAERRAARRKILWDQPPRDAAPRHVEDCVQDLPHRPEGRTTPQGGLWHKGRDYRLFRIRQVGCVSTIHTVMLPAIGQGPRGMSRSGFTTLLDSPPCRPLNLGQTVSDGLFGNVASELKATALLRAFGEGPYQRPVP